LIKKIGLLGKENQMSKVDYVDVLGKDYDYIIFKKDNRIQIIFNPTKDQIRKRGKTEWHIFKTSEEGSTTKDSLEDLRTAILVKGKK
jgi:hypothetical protein